MPAPIPPLPPVIHTDEQPAAGAEPAAPTHRPITPADVAALLLYLTVAVCMAYAAMLRAG